MQLNKLFQLLFGGLGKAWPLTLSYRPRWWNRLLVYFGWQPKVKKPGLEEGRVSEEDITRPKGIPNVVTYREVAGEWERKLHPNWPESAFHIPDKIPHGTVYRVRKGTFLGSGMTAHLEESLEGYAIKSPKANPFDPQREKQNLESMRVEAEVYQRIGPGCPYIPKLVEWNSDTCCLTIELLKNGQLDFYVQGRKPLSDKKDENPPHIKPAIRQRWALQVTRGLSAVHAVGAIHSDLTPRNLLLDADLNLRITDFAGSCINGSSYKVYAGERYVRPQWSFGKKPEISDDLFMLGGVLYFIMTSREPYHEVDEIEAAKLYEAGTFPDTANINCGGAIQGCWNGSLKSADEVLEQLLVAFGKDEDPLYVKAR